MKTIEDRINQLQKQIDEIQKKFDEIEEKRKAEIKRNRF